MYYSRKFHKLLNILSINFGVSNLVGYIVLLRYDYFIVIKNNILCFQEW
jgi:hypothetical protein